MLRLTEPNFEDLIQNHMHCLTTQGRSQKTIDWYASNLMRFSRFLKSYNMPKSVKDIGISEVRRFIHYLQTEVVRWEDSPNIRDSGRLSPLSVHDYGVKVIYFGGQKFRAVTHRMVNTADIDETLTRIETCVKKMG